MCRNHIRKDGVQNLKGTNACTETNDAPEESRNTGGASVSTVSASTDF